MSLGRKTAIGLAAGGGVLFAVSPASAAPLPHVDTIGEAGSPHTVVSGAREQFQGSVSGVRESAQRFAGGIGG